MICISGITDTSRLLSKGRKTILFPVSRASIAIGRAHCMERMLPSRASSHTKSEFSIISFLNSISFQRIQSAIGRS